MAGKSLELGGMSADQVFLKIQEAGVSAADAGIIISDWISGTILGGPRTFDYTTAFAGVEHDCEVTFTRTFEHSDWVDGESVVQAEETISEQGFNVRFHSIEHDLDALGAGLAKLSLCIAGLRLGLRALLDEIKAELNRLEAMRTTDIPPIVKKPPDFIPRKPPVFLGTTEFFGQDVHVWETDAGVITLPSVAPVALGGIGNVRVQRTQSLAKLVAQDRRIQEAIAQGMPKEELVSEFGDVRAEDGQTFGGLIDILPAEARFDDASVLVANVASLEAAALRTTPSGVESIASSLGTSNFADAPIGRLDMVPQGALQALQAAGIDTVSKLAEASPEKLASIAVKQAPGVTESDAAGWSAAAGMLVGMGGGRIG